MPTLVNCSQNRRLLGLAYPRTCEVCGLGPCTTRAPGPALTKPDQTELGQRYFEACQRREAARVELKRAESDLRVIRQQLGWLAND